MRPSVLVIGHTIMSSDDEPTDNEDPSPAAIASDATHLPYSGSKQPSKCTGQTGGRKEERRTLLRLISFVPPDGELSRALGSLSPGECLHGNEINATREDTAFKQSQQEACRQEP